MTNHETLLVRTILDAIGDMGCREAAAWLVAHGLIDRRACERLCVRAEVERLARAGIPRCEAFHITAEKLCCSYEKVRGLFYP